MYAVCVVLFEKSDDCASKPQHASQFNATLASAFQQTALTPQACVCSNRTLGLFIFVQTMTPAAHINGIPYRLVVQSLRPPAAASHGQGAESV